MKNQKYNAYLKEVGTFIPQDRIYTDELRLLAWGTDAGFYRLIPQIVIRSKNEAEVARLLSFAQQVSRELPGDFDITIAPVMDAWGFTFKTVAFVWVKQCRKSDSIFTGMGYWTRANAEICLLATRGHPKRAARDVKQVILSHIEEHSKKPDEARRRIEALMGDVPRIELFARQVTPGWDVWGNEVASDIQLAERS